MMFFNLIYNVEFKLIEYVYNKYYTVFSTSYYFDQVFFSATYIDYSLKKSQRDC